MGEVFIYIRFEVIVMTWRNSSPVAKILRCIKKYLNFTAFIFFVLPFNLYSEDNIHAEIGISALSPLIAILQKLR